MDMYFAVDAIEPAFLPALLREAQAMQAREPGLNLYVLVDAAFAHVKSIPSLDAWRGQGSSLYAGSALSDFGQAAPFIAPVSGMTAQLARLLNEASGLPMLSFIASRLDAAELKAHFLPFLEVATPDGQQMVLRFADTRVLATIDAQMCLAEPQWRAGIAHWWLPTRDGQLAALPVVAEPPVLQAPPGPVALEQGTLDRLLASTEADAIIDAIFDQNSDLLRQRQPSALHALVQRAMLKLEKYDVSNFRDAVMFVTTAISTEESFDLHPAFQACLRERRWEDGHLGAALAALDDAHWDAISPKDEQALTVGELN
jgi:hypothetical protein